MNAAEGHMSRIRFFQTIYPDLVFDCYGLPRGWPSTPRGFASWKDQVHGAVSEQKQWWEGLGTPHSPAGAQSFGVRSFGSQF